MARKLPELSLLDILPFSIADDPQIDATSKALDPELQSASHDIREALILSRIEELPEPVLDLLLWQWHADFPELARTREMKIAMVRGLIAWHRKKGTAWAIKAALAMLGIKGTYIPWWDMPDGKPYTFAVEAEITSGFWSMFPDSQDATKVIRRAILESKSTRSWLVNLDTVIKAEIEHRLYHGIATLAGGRQSIYLEQPGVDPYLITTGIGTCRSGRDVVGASLPRTKTSFLGAGVATLSTGVITIKAA